MTEWTGLSQPKWECELPKNDPVSRPAHYTSGEVECIDGIRAALGDGFVDYCRGNCIKYLWRAGRKGDMTEDLRKARVYLGWAISYATRGDDESCRRIRYFINTQTMERLAWDAPTMPPLDPPISRAHGWTEIDRDAYRVLSREHRTGGDDE